MLLDEFMTLLKRTALQAARTLTNFYTAAAASLRCIGAAAGMQLPTWCAGRRQTTAPKF